MNLKKLLMRTTDKLKLALGKYGVGVTNTAEVINNTYNALYVFHKGTRETSFNIELLFYSYCCLQNRTRTSKRTASDV